MTVAVFLQTAFIIGQALAWLVFVPRTDERCDEHWQQIRGAA